MSPCVQKWFLTYKGYHNKQIVCTTRWTPTIVINRVTNPIHGRKKKACNWGWVITDPTSYRGSESRSCTDLAGSTSEARSNHVLTLTFTDIPPGLCLAKHIFSLPTFESAHVVVGYIWKKQGFRTHVEYYNGKKFKVEIVEVWRSQGYRKLTLNNFCDWPTLGIYKFSYVQIFFTQST